MKKIFKWFLGGCLFYLFTLSSCGGGTKGWPTMSLPFEEDTVIKVNIDYLKRPYRKSDISEEEHYIIEDSEVIAQICERVKMQYNEKQKKYDDEDFWVRVNVIFTYIMENNHLEYEIVYYCYGVTNGVIVFDNTSHEMRGNFYGSVVYAGLKEYLVN